MSVSIIQQIRNELQAKATEKNRQGAEHYFKEDVKFYGVRVPDVRIIAKKAFQQIKGLDKTEIFALCEELFKSVYSEEALLACVWADYLTKRQEPKDFVVFERWINNYVSTWAECDTLCNHPIGSFIEKYPS